MSIRYLIYSSIMKFAHKHNWHYAPPIYPDGDTHLWCQWCGFRQTIKTRDRSNDKLDTDLNTYLQQPTEH